MRKNFPFFCCFRGEFSKFFSNDLLLKKFLNFVFKGFTVAKKISSEIEIRAKIIFYLFKYLIINFIWLFFCKKASVKIYFVNFPGRCFCKFTENASIVDWHTEPISFPWTLETLDATVFFVVFFFRGGETVQFVDFEARTSGSIF